ncbi:amidohydrolase [Shewanella rhizosphaerae]|uniref:amidohydrolase n=1 Tax=Shewanella rhizosphaerae TaxID=2864207 RepID=UPI001C65EB19|nr:amidohydrolase [Shewanella rhizosphaerae]QYK13835.1 amidohydrolase [Shewanella rhizosphaerae]
MILTPRLLITLILLLPGLALAENATKLNGQADYALINAKVYTVNKAQPWADAIAVQGNKITYVGNAEGLKDRLGTTTEVLDLKGKMVLPGFVEGHFHTVAGAMMARGLDLQSDDKQEIFDRIRKYVKDNPDLDVIVGYGVRYSTFGKELPTAAMLDEIESDRPMYFWAIDVHAAWVNSKALELAKVDKTTPEPAPGYSYFVRDDDGNPSGWAFEFPAQLKVLSALVDFNIDYSRSGVEEWLPRFSAAGITSVFDYGVLGLTTEEGFQLLSDLAGEGKLPIRVQGSYFWNDPKIDPIPIVQKLSKQFNTDHVSVKALKINMDGGDEKWNALFTKPWEDKPEIVVEPIIPYEVLNQVVIRADKLGINVTCHCFGDLAVRKLLDAIEGAIKVNPNRERHHVASHAVLVDEADIPRFGKLGVTYDSTGAWMSFDPLLQSITTDRVGSKRVQAMFPMRKIAETGGNISLGADWPAAGYISEYRPLYAIRTAVTRQLPGRDDVPPLGGEEARLPLELAIYAQTLGSAYGMGLNDKIGSLEVGKYADLIVLDKNLFDIEPHSIHDAKVLFTMMDGKTVFDALKHQK